MTKTTQIPHIEDGDSFSATNSYIGNKTVKSVFAIRRSESEPRYRKEMVLNFGGCTDEQLIQLALYGVKVKVQSLLRQMPAETMLHPDTMAKVDVLKDIIEAPSKVGDPLSQAVRSMMKATGLDEAGAKELLATAAAKADARKQGGKQAQKTA